MVESHAQALQDIACGIHALPESRSAFAATQAAYRFLNNDRVSLRALVQPLIHAAREEIPSACDAVVLVVHDWSQLMYPDHTLKRDRIALSSKKVPEGYELQTALLLSDRGGMPLAPVVMSLRAADGVHCSRRWRVREPLSPLDELDPAMDHVEGLALGRPTVHIIDAEADSVWHYRQWSARPGRLFLVRADDRIVERDGHEQRCSAIRQTLRDQAAFRRTREVQYHGQAAQQWVAEVPVRLTRPAQRNRPGVGDRQRIPGPPVDVRLIIAEVRTASGKVLACWYLLTNVPSTIDAATIALWYYWRWSIESYHKLIKSAGMQIEHWQQETAAAIARRLLIASMACVLVWRLARSQHPRAEETRELLVRLSGRQMKHACPFTIPALLAGLWTLLAMLDILKSYTPDELQDLAACLNIPLGQPP